MSICSDQRALTHNCSKVMGLGAICPQGCGVYDAARWPTLPLPSAGGSIWFPSGARRAFLFHQSRPIWGRLFGISSLANCEAYRLRQKTQRLLLVKVKVGPEMC